MNKISRLVIVGMAMGFILVPISYAQKAEWKGKIETENGVKVIKNPKEPLYGELKLELQEDLSIGREDDKNYFFYVVKDIAVDSKSNIYVVDARNYQNPEVRPKRKISSNNRQAGPRAGRISAAGTNAVGRPDRKHLCQRRPNQPPYF